MPLDLKYLEKANSKRPEAESILSSTEGNTELLLYLIYIRLLSTFRRGREVLEMAGNDG